MASRAANSTAFSIQERQRICQRRPSTSFAIEGVEPARVKDMRDLLRDYFRQGWEIREPAEGRFLVQMTEQGRTSWRA